MTDIGIWAYPWDLHDIGLDASLTRIADAGADTVSLAASYHAGRFLQPGNPRRRVYFPQDGTVYYRVDPARWAGATIAPLQADIVADEGDYLGRLCDRRSQGGPKVSAWTVCLHNTRLGMMYPDHVMRTAHGDPQYYALCPSSPAARAYVTGLVAEITQTYQPDRIELESPEFMGFSHGFHHEKDGMGLTPEEDYLLGLCFCDHCRVRAQVDGIPFESARVTVLAFLNAAFVRELPLRTHPDFPTQREDAFASEPNLHAYLIWRKTVVTSLIAEAKAAAHPATQVLLIDYDGSWMGGVDAAAIAPHVDGLLYCAYFAAPPAKIADLLIPIRTALGPDKPLITGFQLCHPNVCDSADLTARVAAARPYADGFNFYNLGLVPPIRLTWISRALSAS
jgi:hypothetical protein